MPAMTATQVIVRVIDTYSCHASTGFEFSLAGYRCTPVPRHRVDQFGKILGPARARRNPSKVGLTMHGIVFLHGTPR
jgi:hypothetical protein